MTVRLVLRQGKNCVLAEAALAWLYQLITLIPKERREEGEERGEERREGDSERE